jgi:hypothetical protein
VGKVAEKERAEECEEYAFLQSRVATEMFAHSREDEEIEQAEESAYVR